MKHTRSPQITGLSSLKIPFGIIMHDLHYKTEERKRYIVDNNVKSFFNLPMPLQGYFEFRKYILIPHFVNTDIFKDYGL